MPNSLKGFISFINKTKLRQFAVSITSTLLVSGLCYFMADTIGYRAVALVLLFWVSLLSVVLSIYPALSSAVLSAIIWDFFFIPPFYTFHVGKPEDIFMLMMYIIIALLIGILTSRIRQFEKQIHLKEERINSIKFYNSLLNSVSHEFRTPLTTIIGTTDNLIQMDTQIDQPTRLELYNEIFQASARLNRLVENLLDMSRLESGLLRPRLDWCDIHELFHSLHQRIKPELGRRAIQLEIPEDFPLVKVDFGLLEQALYNITHNAVMHTPEESTITLSASSDKESLLICIVDDGPGFSETDADILFEKFYRSKISTTGGLGLGLSIAKGFIVMQSGKVFIRNKNPHGAEININIPTIFSDFKETHE